MKRLPDFFLLKSGSFFIFKFYDAFHPAVFSFRFPCKLPCHTLTRYPLYLSFSTILPS